MRAARRVLMWVSSAAMAALLTPPAATAPNETAVQRGLQLYAGAAPLQGAITGHGMPLPPSATRCINCHSIGTARPVKAVSAPSSAPSSFGPLLTRGQLTKRIERRGGPPSAYDETTFCRLLRTGIDPAHVLIPREMPRYTLPDADCHGLWQYLTSLP